MRNISTTDPEIEILLKGRAVVIKRFETISGAINKNELIRFSYTTVDGGRSVRSIKPEEFQKYGDSLCVFGHCYLRDEKRVFSLERMKRVKVVAEPGKSYEKEQGERSGILLPKFRKRTWPVVMRDYTDESGRRYLEAHLTPAGDLEIEGQDVGSAVGEIFGEGFVEYEWVYLIKREDFPLLVKALEAQPGTDILNLLQCRCVGPYGLDVGTIIEDNKIPHEFWNHLGEG